MQKKIKNNKFSTLLLVFLPALAFAEINIKIKFPKATVNDMQFGGHDTKVISDNERTQFSLDHTSLSRSVPDYLYRKFRKQYSDLKIYVNPPLYASTPEEKNIYYFAATEPVHRTFEPVKISYDNKADISSQVELKRQQFAKSNQGHRQFFNAWHEVKFSAEHERSVINTVNLGNVINYEIAIPWSGKFYRLKYKSNWNKILKEEFNVILGNSSKPLDISPYTHGDKSVACLYANLITIKLNINYELSVSEGNILIQFSKNSDKAGDNEKIEGRDFLKRIFGLPTTINFNETITIKFYTDAYTKIFDKNGKILAKISHLGFSTIRGK